MDLIQHDFIRKLKGAALSVLLALYASAASLGVGELVAATGWSRSEIQRGLRQLNALGWVEQQQRYHGWALVDHIRQKLQMWLQPGGRELARGLPDLSRHLEVVNDINIKIKNNTSTRDSDSAAMSLPEPPPSIERDISALPQIERVLSATGRLFDEPVWGPPGRYPDARLLLAWIARAYQLRSRLEKPARVVFRNLQNQRLPPQRYLDDPLHYLPQDFLIAAGLALPPGPACDPDEDFEILSPQDTQRPATQQDPSLDFPLGQANRGNGMALNAAQAWEQALALLVVNMTARTFARWVAPAVLLRYKPPPDPGDPALFSVQVPSDFLRALWLDRLVPALCRQLIGFCACEVAIRVDVADDQPGFDEK